jgi:hypothetical protein
MIAPHTPTSPGFARPLVAEFDDDLQSPAHGWGLPANHA